MIEGATTIILDTSVVSELMRTSPDSSVTAWIAKHPVEDLFFSAVGEFELRYGVSIMLIGRRGETLVSEIETMLQAAFENRILPFDSRAARVYAVLAAKRRFAGRAVAPANRQIAAIARARGMAVATRNVWDFENMGIDVYNPWDAT